MKMTGETIPLLVGAGLGVGVLAGVVSGVCFILANGLGWSRRVHRGALLKAEGSKEDSCVGCGSKKANAVECTSCTLPVCGSCLDEDQGAVRCQPCTNDRLVFTSSLARSSSFLQLLKETFTFRPTTDENLNQLKVARAPGAVEAPTATPTVSGGSADEGRQIREFLQHLAEKLTGGSLDDVSVTRMYQNHEYLPVTNMESASNAHSRLQRLIQRIIEEALHLPAFLDFSGNLRDPSGKLPEFNPKTYEDLLATAILNKVIDRYQQDPKRSTGASSSGVHSGSSSPGGDDIPLTGRIARRRGRPRTSARESSGLDRSSPEPASHDDYANSDSSGRASVPLKTAFLKNESTSDEDEPSKNVYKDPVETALSTINFKNKTRVAFPEYGGDVIELDGVTNSGPFIDESYLDTNGTLNNNTEIYTNNNSWEENWLFQKKKLKNSQSVSVPMLVPNPNTEYRALIGDRDAEDTTDLSEAGSETDEKLDESTDIKKVLINSKTIIGGKNPVLPIMDQDVKENVNCSPKQEKNSEMIKSDVPNNVETNNNTIETNVETAASNENDSQKCTKQNIEPTIIISLVNKDCNENISSSIANFHSTEKNHDEIENLVTSNKEGINSNDLTSLDETQSNQTTKETKTSNQNNIAINEPCLESANKEHDAAVNDVKKADILDNSTQISQCLKKGEIEEVNIHKSEVVVSNEENTHILDKNKINEVKSNLGDIAEVVKRKKEDNSEIRDIIMQDIQAGNATIESIAEQVNNVVSKDTKFTSNNDHPETNNFSNKKDTEATELVPLDTNTKNEEIKNNQNITLNDKLNENGSINQASHSNSLDGESLNSIASQVDEIILKASNNSLLDNASLNTIASQVDEMIIQAIKANIIATTPEITAEDRQFFYPNDHALHQVSSCEQNIKQSIIENNQTPQESTCERKQLQFDNSTTIIGESPFKGNEETENKIKNINSALRDNISAQVDQIIMQAIKDNIVLAVSDLKNEMHTPDVSLIHLSTDDTEHQAAYFEDTPSLSIIEEEPPQIFTKEIKSFIDDTIEHSIEIIETMSSAKTPEVNSVCSIVETSTKRDENVTSVENSNISVKEQLIPGVLNADCKDETEDQLDKSMPSLHVEPNNFVSSLEVDDKQDTEGHQRESEYLETISVPVQRHMDSLKRQHNIKNAEDVETPPVPTSRLPDKKEITTEEIFIPGYEPILYFVEDYVDPKLLNQFNADKEQNKRFGSIAEREHKKWQNAVPMENNPYSPEAIERRLQKQNKTSPFDEIVVANATNPTLDEGNEVKPKALQEVFGEDLPEYRRYGRDYYINQSKKATGGRKQFTGMDPQHSYEEHDNAEVDRPVFIRSASETPTWKSKVPTEENNNVGQIDNNVKMLPNDVTIPSDQPDGLYSAVPAKSEPELYLATPVLIENVEDQFDNVYETTFNNETTMSSQDKNDSKLRNGSATQSDVLEVSDVSISSPDDSLHVYNIQSGRVLSEANREQYNEDNEYNGEDFIEGEKITSSALNNINKSWKSTGDVYLAAIENKESKEKSNVIEEDINLPSVKNLRMKFVAENKEEIPEEKPRRKLSKEFINNAITKTYSSSQSNLKQPLHMHSLTARSIPKEFRDELKLSMPVQANTHPGGSKEIPQGAEEPIKEGKSDRPVSPQPEPGSLRNKLAFFEKLNHK